MSTSRFTSDTLLYCDNDYFQSTIGGFNNVGFGTSVVSFSLGWSRSLQSVQMEKLKNPSTDLSIVCTKSDAVVLGYITFSRSIDDELFTNIQDNLEMNGVEWQAAIVCSQKVQSISDLANSSWSIAYFRKGSFSWPRDRFDDIDQPVNIFGSILPMQMSGRACIMKAHAAAYIAGLARPFRRRL